MTISIPLGSYDLRADFRGFETLGALHEQLSRIASDSVEIDCERLGWMDAQMSSPFMTVLQQSARRGNTHSLTRLAQNVKLILQKNGMMKVKAVDTNRTTMPITFYPLHDEVAFAQYTRTHMARKEMPRMSQALQIKFFEGIDELFANCSLHSRSDVSIAVAGQFFPKAHRLSFAITDGGQGIDGSLRNAGHRFASPELAIDWAMQPRNTSRQGDIPGGLGLRLLRDFVEANEGKLTVASRGGYWVQNGSSIRKRKMRTSFPGTAVVLEIKTSDDKHYDYVPTDPNNIW